MKYPECLLVNDPGLVDSWSIHRKRPACSIPPATRPFRVGGPPIWLGGATPAALARTGRLYDGWLPYPPDPADYESGLLDIRNAAARAGRSPDDITPALFVSVRVDSSLQSGRRVLGDYAIANYGMPLEELERIQAIVTGTPQRVVESLNVPADGVHLGDLAVLDARMRLP